jgi:hypothetical protein
MTIVVVTTNDKNIRASRQSTSKRHTGTTIISKNKNKSNCNNCNNKNNNKNINTDNSNNDNNAKNNNNKINNNNDTTKIAKIGKNNNDSTKNTNTNNSNINSDNIINNNKNNNKNSNKNRNNDDTNNNNKNRNSVDTNNNNTNNNNNYDDNDKEDNTIKETRKSRRTEFRKRKRAIEHNNKNNNSNNDAIHQRVYDICKQRYGIIADPSFSVLKNVRHLTETIHPLDLPRQPRNLKVHNLCKNANLISAEMHNTLGLNLSFGVSLPPLKDKIPIDLERLKRSIRLKFIKFPPKVDNETYVPKLHAKSDWPPPNAPTKVEKAMNKFEEATKKAFIKSWAKPHIPNIDKQQVDLLRKIKKERKYIVVAADKNLGPCIIEIEQYINRCLKDHLNNNDTYKELREIEARIINEDNFRWLCKYFIDDLKANLTKQARTFFILELFGGEMFRDAHGKAYKLAKIGLPYFYILPKVHKDPWASRPVVSGVTSVMKCLSIWLDVQLQNVVHLCPCYLKDSWQFLNDIKTYKNAKGYKLVTSDATAMYTNINTEHAIDIMKRWFELHEKDLPVKYPKELVLEGIKRLMSNNTFSFGNRFFLQRNGTAMGTNVACMYATIYYSYHEETQLLHLSYIKFYRRLIDDAFIIFDPNASFENLETNMNEFGPATKRLHWKTEQPADTVDFLDLTVTIQPDGTITTRTFQKKMNLYLYRTPDSCQPESIIRSFIYGALHRYYWQNTATSDFLTFVGLLFERMLDRGHQYSNLIPIFEKASKKVETSSMPNPKNEQREPDEDNDNNENNIYIHLPHHPNNPTTDELRTIANNLKQELSTQSNIKLDRIIIAYSKAPNIGDLCKRHRMEDHIDTNEQQ